MGTRAVLKKVTGKTRKDNSEKNSLWFLKSLPGQLKTGKFLLPVKFLPVR